MLTVLYTFFIAPLEALMTAVLGAAHDLIGSYGWSVAVMSLVVNTLILPIYNKAESWQEEERRIKKGFEATEAMIKRTFKGQERFAMLTTMRRQHGYSARLALRSSLGFFLQIPFFIAAYHLLSNMPELRGVAFGPITDLGAADGLIKLGGFSINVLPLLMTAVNLLSAFVYTASLSKQDKIQLYGLSALFLVLLYASPAALTLYWTLNNVYSLGKNIVEKSLLPAWRAKHADRTGSAPDAAEGAASAPSKGFAWVLGTGVLLLLYAVWDTNGLWKNTIGLGGIPDAGRLEAFLMMLALSTSLISEGLRRPSGGALGLHEPGGTHPGAPQRPLSCGALHGRLRHHGRVVSGAQGPARDRVGLCGFGRAHPGVRALLDSFRQSLCTALALLP